MDKFELSFWPNVIGVETVSIKVLGTSVSGPFLRVTIPFTVSRPGEPQDPIDIQLGLQDRVIRVSGTVLGVTPRIRRSSEILGGLLGAVFIESKFQPLMRMVNSQSTCIRVNTRSTSFLPSSHAID